MSTKINLLKDGLNNTLMLIYQEYLSMGYNEAEAKLYTSKILGNYLQNFDVSGIIIRQGIEDKCKKLEKQYMEETDESKKRTLYLKIETMVSALDIIKEVTN